MTFTFPNPSLSIILPNQSDLSSVQNDITQSTYNLLTRVRTWPAFSNHTPGDGGSSSNSLEAIHDEIHGTIGGQMGDPSVAGTFCVPGLLGNG
jgi:Common central domain of tyrosinase